ncbi:hypothetical protein ACVWZ3_002412 [Bradyrhizobium sp. i1.3.6]
MRPLGIAETERAGGTAAQGDRARRIEIEQLDVGAITPADRANTERDVGAEMRVGDLVDALAAGNDRLQRCGIEQHRPDLLGRPLYRGLPLTAQPPVAFAHRRGSRAASGRRRFGTAHQLCKPRRHQRQGDIGNAERVRDCIGEADGCGHAIALTDAFCAERRERRRRLQCG